MKRPSFVRLGMDVFMLLMLSMASVLIFLLPYINPNKNSDQSASAHQGQLIVELFWDDSSNADVDLWVKAPDEEPVGFTNRSGQTFNLLRDDLGNTRDVSGRNMEIAYGRGLQDGEYIINAQLYNPKTTELPMEVLVVVSEQKKNSTRKLYSVRKKFDKMKQWETMGSFFFQHGKYEPESLSFNYKPVR